MALAAALKAESIVCRLGESIREWCRDVTRKGSPAFGSTWLYRTLCTALTSFAAVLCCAGPEAVFVSALFLNASTSYEHTLIEI